MHSDRLPFFGREYNAIDPIMWSCSYDDCSVCLCYALLPDGARLNRELFPSWHDVDDVVGFSTNCHQLCLHLLCFCTPHFSSVL